MAVETVNKIAVSIRLDQDVDKIVSVNLGTLSKNAWDANKVMAIVDALESCFTYSLNEVRKTTTSTIERDD